MASAKTVRAACAMVTSLVIDGVLAAAALAQGPPSTPPMAPSTSTASPDGGGWIVATVLVIGLLAFIGVVVKLYDLRGKREAEAVHIQAQISDAMLREPNLFGLPIAATAHAPLWSGTPVTVNLAGEVPGPTVRDTVLRLARDEAQRIRPDVEIVDHLYVRAGERVA